MESFAKCEKREVANSGHASWLKYTKYQRKQILTCFFRGNQGTPQSFIIDTRPYIRKTNTSKVAKGLRTNECGFSLFPTKSFGIFQNILNRNH